VGRKEGQKRKEKKRKQVKSWKMGGKIAEHRRGQEESLPRWAPP